MSDTTTNVVVAGYHLTWRVYQPPRHTFSAGWAELLNIYINYSGFTGI